MMFFYSLVKFRKYDLRQISDKPSICSLYGLDVKSLIFFNNYVGKIKCNAYCAN